MKFLKFSIVLSLTLLLGLSCPIKREIKTYLGIETATLNESTLKPNQTVNCVNYHAAKKLNPSSKKQDVIFPSRFFTTTSFHSQNDSPLTASLGRDEVVHRIPIYILHEQYRL